MHQVEKMIAICIAPHWIPILVDKRKQSTGSVYVHYENVQHQKYVQE